MRSDFTVPRKRIQSVTSFSGMNRVDTAAPGTWYDMENLSDTYAPLLAPRRSRALFASLPGAAQEILYKEGAWYYTVQGEGIYCYAPDSVHPFYGSRTEEAICLYPSSKAYKLYEMGKNMICVPTDASAGAVSLKTDDTALGQVKKLGYNEDYHYLNLHALFSDTSQIRRLSAYRFRRSVYHDSTETVDIVYNYSPLHPQGGLIGSEEVFPAEKDGGLYDAHADTLLNISFTYAVQRDDGTYYVYDNQNNEKFSPTHTGFGASRYFMGTDNGLYYFDYDARAVTPVTAPCIAILFRLGTQRYPASDNAQAFTEKVFASLNAGDYIHLTVGKSLNRRHPLWESEENILPKQLLRVVRSFAVDPEGAWGQRGWTHCIFADYDSRFIDLLCKKDLIYRSTAYTLPCKCFQTPGASEAAIAADRGLQQLYPDYVYIENAFPAISNCLEHNNRVWGTDNTHNEIKASVQGNFEVWDDYRGLVSDSYAVSVGSNDDFTASCAIDDCLYFFKEHSYTLLYGTRPSNFTTNTRGDFIGMDAQCACSLQVIGKYAYYMGIDGRFYRLNASGATVISRALGDKRYVPLSSAHSGEKYYVLVREVHSDTRRLLVYNTLSGTWWAEDAADVEALTCVQAKACALMRCESEAGIRTDIMILEPWEIPDSENNAVQWWCESGLIGLESDTCAYLSAVKITLESEKGARLEVLAKYEEDAAYVSLGTFLSRKKGMHSLEIPLRRSEYLRLKIRGTGFSKIYALRLITIQAGEK